MNTKRFTKLLALILALVMCASALTACSTAKTEEKQPEVTDPATTEPEVTEPENAELEASYLEAVEKLEQKDYEAAYALFTQLGDYKDAKAEAAKFRYMPTGYTIAFSYMGFADKSTTTFTFNENNLPSQGVDVYEDGNTYTYDFTYNENGLMTNKVLQGEETRNTWEFFYDENGNLIKRTSPDPMEENNIITEESTYNENGDLLTLVETDTLGKYVSNESVYDEKGNEVQVLVKENDVVYTLVTEFNEDNQPVRRSKVLENGEEVGVEYYVYNEKGLEIKCYYEEDGTQLQFFDFEYDENDQLVYEYFEDVEGYVYIIEYTYDENGNLVKKTEKDNSDFVYTTETEYTLVYIPFEYTETQWEDLIEQIT